MPQIGRISNPVEDAIMVVQKLDELEDRLKRLEKATPSLREG